MSWRMSLIKFLPVICLGRIKACVFKVPVKALGDVKTVQEIAAQH